MKNDILDNYEMLTTYILTSIGALEVVYRWLDDLSRNKLGYYEFSEFKSQYADVLSLAIEHLIMLSGEHQKSIESFRCAK